MSPTQKQMLLIKELSNATLWIMSALFTFLNQAYYIGQFVCLFMIVKIILQKILSIQCVTVKSKHHLNQLKSMNYESYLSLFHMML